MPRTRELAPPPSGPWGGYYVQSKRKSVMTLTLTFADGRLTGQGSDWVGAFTLAGTLDPASGEVVFVKQYVGRHAIDYRGKWSGRMVRGHWSWPGATAAGGTFRLEPGSRATTP